MTPRGRENFHRKFIVADRARQRHCADGGRAQRENFFLACANPLFHEKDELAEIFSINFAKFFWTARNFPRDERRRTTERRIFVVIAGQISEHDPLEKRATIFRTRLDEERALIGERSFERREEQRLFALEVRVKTAAREAHVFHERIDADAALAALAITARRG